MDEDEILRLFYNCAGMICREVPLAGPSRSTYSEICHWLQLHQQLSLAASDSWAFLQKLLAHLVTYLLQLIAECGIDKINIVVAILDKPLETVWGKALFYTSSSSLQLPPSALLDPVVLVKRGNPTSI